MPDSDAPSTLDGSPPDGSPTDADARRLARDLLAIGAVTLAPDEPFTWSSGRRAPIYCDNRLTLAHPPVRRRIAQGFTQQVATHDLAPDVVAGTATAGIPHAAWLAERLNRPMAYVRDAAKDHGQQNRIEGRIEDGETVVVVEDLISTGQSALSAVEAVRAAGATVAAVVAVFSYDLDASAERFAAADVPLHVLTTFPVLIEEAHAQDALSAEALDLLRAWRADPKAWSDRFT